MKKQFKFLLQKSRLWLNNRKKQLIFLKKRIFFVVDRYPLRSFYGLLGLIILLIVLGNLLQQKVKEDVPEAAKPKSVEIYHVDTVPTINAQAQIRKSGVIDIVAQTSGIVQNIAVFEGEVVSKGKTLVFISTNYQGGNAFSTQRQLAQTQYQNTLDSFPLQQELIQKQREIAEKTDANTDELRAITQQSVDETKTLISINETILDTLTENLKILEQDPNPTDAKKAEILGLRQQIAQSQLALNSARTGLRTSEFQASNEKPPAKLSNLQKEVAIKQLDLQQKQLDLGKDVARLQVVLAQINEGLTFPSSPFQATVQRIYVNIGDAVNPGTKLLTLAQAPQDDPITAIAFVSKEIAQKVSRIQSSKLHIGKTIYESAPSFVSEEAVSQTLYAIYYPIPDSYSDKLTNKGSIEVEIPIGHADTTSTSPFLPIDSVYQSGGKTYIFVAKDNKAQSKEVIIGSVYGSFVGIEKGLTPGDRVIISRTVIEGDPVIYSE